MATFTKNDLPIFKVGTKIAYRYTSESAYGDIGTIANAELHSEDDEFDDYGIMLTIAISDKRVIFRDAEEVILLK